MSTSEIKRITDKAIAKCEEGRASKKARQDDEFVIDVIYLLERSVQIIDALSNRKSVIYDDVLTVKKMQAIVDGIGEPELERFFHRKIAEGLGVDMSEPVKIGRADIKKG